MLQKKISSKNFYPTRKEIVDNLSTLDDGLHQILDEQNRVYQGIVKNHKVLFYVSSLGVVYQDNGVIKDSEQDFKEVGGLNSPDDFKAIAEFNKWVK